MLGLHVVPAWPDVHISLVILKQADFEERPRRGVHDASKRTIQHALSMPYLLNIFFAYDKSSTKMLQILGNNYGRLIVNNICYFSKFKLFSLSSTYIKKIEKIRKTTIKFKNYDILTQVILFFFPTFLICLYCKTYTSTYRPVL